MMHVTTLQYTCQPSEADGEQCIMRKQKRNRNFRPLRQVLVLCQVNCDKALPARLGYPSRCAEEVSKGGFCTIPMKSG